MQLKLKDKAQQPKAEAKEADAGPQPGDIVNREGWRKRPYTETTPDGTVVTYK